MDRKQALRITHVNAITVIPYILIGYGLIVGFSAAFTNKTNDGWWVAVVLAGFMGISVSSLLKSILKKEDEEKQVKADLS